MNKYGDSYSTYFHLLKTSKNIAEIKDKISDRLIITKDGKMYFDYSNNERIEISHNKEQYKTELEFTNVNEIVTYSYNDIKSDIKTIAGENIKSPTLYTLVFDNMGNMGMVVGIDSLDGTVDVHILTKNITEAQVMDYLTIKRYVY